MIFKRKSSKETREQGTENRPGKVKENRKRAREHGTETGGLEQREWQKKWGKGPEICRRPE